MIKQKRALVTNVALGMGLFLVGCASPVGEASPIGTSASAIDDRDPADVPEGQLEELEDPERSEQPYGPDDPGPLDPYQGDEGPYGPDVGEEPPLDRGPHGPGMGVPPVDQGPYGPDVDEEPPPDEGPYAPGMGGEVPMEGEEEGEPLEQGADETEEGTTGTVESEVRRFPRHRHGHPHWGRHGHGRHPHWRHPHRHWRHPHRHYRHPHWGWGRHW